MQRLLAAGADGCPRAQPLAAIGHALTDQRRNAGFRRHDAALLLVIVTAGDDASPAAVPDHVHFLRGLAPPGGLHVVTIHGAPAPRLDELATALAAEHLPIDGRITAAHLWWPFSGNGWHELSPCLEGHLADGDPIADGVQPRCSVSEAIVESDGTRVLERVLPTCDATASERPCWRLIEDPQRCIAPWSPTHVSLTIERHDYAPAGTHVLASCVTE